MSAVLKHKETNITQQSHRKRSLETKSFPSRTCVVQPKLELTTPGDSYEREADRMADFVMRKVYSGLPTEMPSATSVLPPVISRRASSSTSGVAVGNATESGIHASRGGGQPMPEALRSQMESGFGADFSGVRLHTDSKAADLSRGIQAKAFTYGNDIYFNRGQYQPYSAAGQHLIAHELTHVVQQSGKVGREDDTTKTNRIPIEKLKVSEDGKNLIKALEGFREETYDDSGGYCTIGYGHLIAKKKCKDIKGIEERSSLLQNKGLNEVFEEDVLNFEKKVKEHVKVPLYQHEYDALVSLAFNIGSLGTAPNLCRFINEKQYERASIEMLDIVNAGGKVVTGLKNRRVIEFNLFNKNIYLFNSTSKHLKKQSIKHEHYVIIGKIMERNQRNLYEQQRDKLNKLYPEIQEQPNNGLLARQNENEGGQVNKETSITDNIHDDSIPLVELSEFNRNERAIFLFGDKSDIARKGERIYKSKKEAEGVMVKIDVNAWKENESGEKIGYKLSLKVHKKLAPMIIKIFNDIYKHSDKFVILDAEMDFRIAPEEDRKKAKEKGKKFKGVGTAAFDWRYDNRYIEGDKELMAFSEHAAGVAIDINSRYNPFRKGANPYEAGHKNTKYGGKYDKYTIKSGSSVVEIFKKYGWSWGGNWRNKKDYMHFEWFSKTFPIS